MRTLFGAPATALLLAMLFSAAQAQDCNPHAGGNAVTGTLTAPQPPCRPPPARPSERTRAEARSRAGRFP